MTSGPSAHPRRYLALRFPFLPADRWKKAHRANPSAEPAKPRVFAEKAGNALRIGAVDAAAHALGLRPGMPLADARARFGKLDVADLDRAGDEALLRLLARRAVRYSPSVCIDRDDALTLDITGCAHLFGGEASMLAEIAARLEAWGMSVQAAIAGTADAAQAIARYGKGGVIAEGGEAQAVARFPVHALRIDDDSAGKLIHLGLKTIGHLAVRPRKPLAARFGSILLDRLDRTRGLLDIPPPTLKPLPLVWAERRFFEPIARSEDIAHTLLDLATLAGAKLDLLGSGGRIFEALFFRSDGDQRRIVARTSVPTRDAVQIRRLFDERLDTLDDPLSAGFGFDLIRLVVRRHERLAFAQVTLDANQHATAQTAAIVDQLAARLGDAHVLRLSQVDSHDPGRASRLMSVLDPAMPPADWSATAERPLTLFEPPQLLEVVLSEVPDGPPRQFRWRRKLYRVARQEGPERIAPEWWRKLELAQSQPDVDERDRDYFQVEDRDGHRYWLYRLGIHAEGAPKPRWYLHGLSP